MLKKYRVFGITILQKIDRCIVSLIFSLITALPIDCSKYIIKEMEIYSTIADIN